MRINIEFDDKEDALVAMKAYNYLGVITEIDNYCRGILKHTDCSDDVADHLQKIRNFINGIHLE